MTDLGSLPLPFTFLNSQATAINTAGEVVGYTGGTESDESGGQSIRAFLWIPDSVNGTTGHMIDLGDLPGGDDISEAAAINTEGDVVGYSSTHEAGTSLSQDHAFLWTDAEGMVDLNMHLDISGANWILEQAEGINDAGQIVGFGEFDPDGAGPDPAVEHAFLLTPVPEPTTLGLLVVGILLPQFRRR